jgi:hypothetical protein
MKCSTLTTVAVIWLSQRSVLTRTRSTPTEVFGRDLSHVGGSDSLGGGIPGPQLNAFTMKGH